MGARGGRPWPSNRWLRQLHWIRIYVDAQFSIKQLNSDLALKGLWRTIVQAHANNNHTLVRGPLVSALLILITQPTFWTMVAAATATHQEFVVRWVKSGWVYRMWLVLTGWMARGRLVINAARANASSFLLSGCVMLESGSDADGASAKTQDYHPQANSGAGWTRTGGWCPGLFFEYRLRRRSPQFASQTHWLFPFNGITAGATLGNVVQTEPDLSSPGLLNWAPLQFFDKRSYVRLLVLQLTYHRWYCYTIFPINIGLYGFTSPILDIVSNKGVEVERTATYPFH